MNDITLLETALNYSSNIIIIGSSLRNSAGAIDNFSILLANRKAEEITGLSVSELVGHTVRDVFPAGVPANIWEEAAEVVKTGLSRTIDSQFVLDSGEIRWFSITLHRYQDGISAFFDDVTATWQAEQSLRKTVDELQRSNQNLEQFAYVASHDLQEPLRKLIGFGDILKSQHQASLDEEGLKLLQRMQSATQRMHTLIRELLGFSRLTSANNSFKRVNLQGIVDEVLNDLEPVIREKKAILDVTSLPYLEGDAGQLGQLFQNLLSNALKFIRPGEIPLIRIDCEVIQGSYIQPMPGTMVLATDLNRSFFAIVVSDNGIGFDEKYRDRIFTIFQRLHTRAEYPGTGIGLAVVQRVVDNHKGYLNARSEPGKGAEFTIYLPDEPALPGMAGDL